MAQEARSSELLRDAACMFESLSATMENTIAQSSGPKLLIIHARTHIRRATASHAVPRITATTMYTAVVRCCAS